MSNGDVADHLKAARRIGRLADVDGFAATFGVPTRLFLAGNSEGAMVASRYTHSKLERWGNLKGRILTAWSCEYNYFVSCRQHAAIGTPTVPILNLISNSDEFFASTNSVASAVAAPGPGAYGDPPTGSCASGSASRSQESSSASHSSCSW